MKSGTSPSRHSAIRLFGMSIAGVLAISALSLTGCSTSAAPTSSATTAVVGGLEPHPLAQKTTVTINTAARIESFTALFLAQEKGEFAKENLDVQFTQVPSSDALAGLGQNQIQMMGLSPSGSLFNAINSGVDIKAVFPGYLNNLGEDGWWMNADVIKAGAGSLKGQVVASAVGPGSGTILGLDAYLKTGGLTVKDVTVKSFPAADVSTALLQGAVQGAYLTAPATVPVSASGKAKYVDSMPKDGGSAIAVYLFGPGLLKQNPEVGQAIVRAMARTVNTYLIGDYKANDGLVADIAKALNRTPEEIKATPSFEFDPKLKIRDDLYVQMQKLWLEVGGILSYDTPLDPAKVIDTSFVDAALGN